MPVPIVCSGCSAKLSAPDTAAGKRIKCPKCQAVCSVPAPAPAAPKFEVVEEVVDAEPVPEPAPKAAKPVAKAKAVVDDDDERPRAKKKSQRDEEADDRPRKRKRRDDDEEEKPRKSPALLIGIIAGVLLLAGGGFAAYWFGFRDKTGSGDGRGGGSTVKLEGWEEYTSPDNVFKASFPGKPQSKPASVMGQKVTSNIAQHLEGSTRLGEQSLAFFAGYIRFPESTQANEIETARKWLITMHAAPATYGGGQNAPAKVTVGGRTWEESSFPSGKSTGLIRWHQVGPTLHVIGYRAENQPPPKDAAEQFLASHQILDGVPADPDPDPIPVSLENWKAYTSEKSVFKASFPGESKAKTDYFFKTATAAEFREYTVKDEKTRQTKTYIVGYAQFAKKPVFREVKEVKEYVSREVFGRDLSSSQRVTVGGWPWGEEIRRAPASGTDRFDAMGIVRTVEARTTVFAMGLKHTGRMPPEKEVEKFFGGFEILAKPSEKDFAAPPDWVRYWAPTGEFQARAPGFNKSTVPPAMGNMYAGVALESHTEYKGYDQNVTLNITVVRYPPNTPETDRRRVLEVIAGRYVPPSTNKKPVETKTVTWAGRDALEHSVTRNHVAGATWDGGVIREIADANVGIVAMALSRSGPPSPDVVKAFFDSFVFNPGVEPPSKTNPPPGWNLYQPEKVGFHALMPGKQGISGRDLKLTNAQRVAVGSVRMSRATEGANIYTVLVVRFVSGATDADREAAMKSLAAPVALTPAQAKVESEKKIVWAEWEATEHVFSPSDLCVLRRTHNATTGYIAAVHVQTGKLDAEKALLFLDSFTLDKE